MSSHMVSAVGDDEDGATVLRALSTRDISVEDIVVRKGATARQRIIVNPNGERVFDGYRTGVLATLGSRDIPFSSLSHFDALHVPLSDGLEALFDAVAQQVTGIIKIADLSMDGPNGQGLQASVERYLPYFDLVCIGGKYDDLGWVKERAASFPHKTVVLTLGSRGAVCLRGREIYEQEAVPVSKVVDTTGCGDGFQAAFIARWLADRDDIRGALSAGVAQGGKVASIFGATECIIED